MKAFYVLTTNIKRHTILKKSFNFISCANSQRLVNTPFYNKKNFDFDKLIGVFAFFLLVIILLPISRAKGVYLFAAPQLLSPTMFRSATNMIFRSYSQQGKLAPQGFP